jgi:hypothetical protein
MTHKALRDAATERGIAWIRRAVASLREVAARPVDGGTTEELTADADALDTLLALLPGDGDEYEVWHDEMCVAGASGPGAEAEAMHYAIQYAEDGPARVERITRTVVCELNPTDAPDGERR